MLRFSLPRVVALLLAIAGAQAVFAGGDLLTSRPLPKKPDVKTIAVGGEIHIDKGEPQRVLLPDGSRLYVNQNTRIKLLDDNVLSLDGGEVFLDVDPVSDKRAKTWSVRTTQREIKASATADAAPRFAVRVEEKGASVVVTRGSVQVGRSGEPSRTVRAGEQLSSDKDTPTAAPRTTHRLAWTRDLMSADAALIPPSEYAGGSLVAADAEGQSAKLQMRKLHMDVFIQDGFARTTIDQTYFNQTEGRLEGTFYFPLPPDASLSGLTMYVNGDRMDGGMVERDYGRTVYETIVNKQKDPALLEWLDGSTFKMRVFPLEPRQEKRIILSYTQKLSSLYGQAQYRFPAGHSLDTVRDWSFQATVKHGADLAWSSPSHALAASEDNGDVLLKTSEKNVKANRDVVLMLAPKDAAHDGEPRYSSVEQDGAGYLMLRYRPDLPSQKVRERRDWIFVVESSADRDPLLMRTQIEIVRGLLAAAEPDDTFTVLAVNNRAYAFGQEADSATPQHVAGAIAFLENAHLIGALDLGQGLAKAEPYLRAAKNPYLVHIGSGVAAMGERGLALLKRLPDNVRYIGVGVGHRWDRAFMKNAADKTGGYFTQINPDEPIAWRAFELAATLNTPRLMDVSVRAGADGPAWLTTANSLAQGEELCAIVRFNGTAKLPENVTVRGVLNGKLFEQTISVKDVATKAGYLPRIWAKLEIDRLLAENPVKHRDAIIALSKAMVVMTPFTSLLVLENEEMYQQYKVERSRKDHWALYESPAKIPVVYEPEDGEPGDPKKGIKPSAKSLAQTIVRRESPPLLKQPEGGEIEYLAKKWMALDAPLSKMERDDRSILAGAPIGSAAGAPAGDFGLPTSNSPITLGTTFESRTRESMLQFIPASTDAIRVQSQKFPVITGTTTTATGFATASVTYEPPVLSKILVGDVFADGGLLAGITPRRDAHRGDPTLYARPRYSGNANFFADLVAFAPGLNTTRADVRAVMEAEAALTNNKAGTIDDSARDLFQKARQSASYALTMPADGVQPAYTIAFDDAGHYQYQRTLPIGMREQVICDGKTILHLYPDLGLAARRSVSRFHRMEFAQLVPQALPAPEDYARGADLRVIGERIVAVVPHGAAVRDADGKPIPYVELHLIFSAKGPLAERRYVEMPSKKTVAIEQLSENGEVKTLNADGKETAVRKSVLKIGAMQSLAPDLKQYVVLPLPYRTPQHVVKTLGIEKKSHGDLKFEEGHALLAAYFASGGADNAAKVFQQCFHERDQRQLGYYVLLAACGNNLDGDHFDLLTEHPNEPLAQYLALHSSPILRKHATQWAVASNPWGDGWLNRLATAHALYQRWGAERPAHRAEAQQQAEREKALDYVKRNKGSALAWALLGLVQDRALIDDDGKKEQGQETVIQRRATWLALAEAWSWFADQPAFAYQARYENARCLWKAGQTAEARKQFRALYEETLATKTLPPLDADFRQALLGNGEQSNEWKDVMRRTAKQLLGRKEYSSVLALAAQCWHVGDQMMANDLLDETLGNVRDGKEYLPLVQSVIEVLIENGQLEQADQKVQALLHDKDMEQKPALHRLAMRIAALRDQPARQMRHLERALELEFQDRPDEIDLRRVRSEYSDLLSHYQRLAEAMESLSGTAPPNFNMMVARTADRWRALDPQATEPCDLAARILRTRGDRDLAWDYLTTPVALHPYEAQPWQDMAATLARQGDLGLADRAYEAAFDAEPTNAQILWDRAQNLRQLGKTQDMQKLLRKLADGQWQPRFNWIQQQAKWQLEKR